MWASVCVCGVEYFVSVFSPSGGADGNLISKSSQLHHRLIQVRKERSAVIKGSWLLLLPFTPLFCTPSLKESSLSFCSPSIPEKRLQYEEEAACTLWRTTWTLWFLNVYGHICSGKILFNYIISHILFTVFGYLSLRCFVYSFSFTCMRCVLNIKFLFVIIFVFSCKYFTSMNLWCL